jgi:hypothetical protein
MSFCITKYLEYNPSMLFCIKQAATLIWPYIHQSLHKGTNHIEFPSLGVNRKLQMKNQVPKEAFL